MNIRKARGFTLIEIMVVLAVLVVLVAILFPVFSRVRESSRRTACQGNMRQITLAIQQYVQDNEARFPQWKLYWRGLSPYLKNTQVFQCPTDVTPQGSDANSYNFIDYILNSNDLNTGPLTARVGVNEANVPKSSTTLLLKEQPVNIPYPAFTDACGISYWAEIHVGGANYSFLDGHVKWLKPSQAAAIRCQNISGL